MDLRIPLFDAIVQGNENAVLNVLYLSGYNGIWFKNSNISLIVIT